MAKEVITSLSGSHGIKNCYRAMAICSGLMPYVPFVEEGFNLLDTFSVLFAVSFSALWLYVAPIFIGNISSFLRFPGIPLSLFYFSLFISLFVAFFNEVTFTQWSRGLIPFIFLSVFYVTARLLRDKRISYEFAYGVILLGAAAWLVKGVVICLLNYSEITTGLIGRITYLSMDFIVPFSLVGFLCALFGEGIISPRIRVILCFMFFGVSVLSGYRSQVLLELICVLVYVGLHIRSVKQFAFNTAAAAFIFALIVVATPEAMLEEFQLRVKQSEDEFTGSRSAEITFALEKFWESPLLGKGLGFQVPIEVTQYGAVGYGLSERASVGYMHNFVAYFLMTLGLFGTVNLLIFFLGPVWMGFARIRLRGQWSSIEIGVLLLIVSLLAYCLVQAAMRLIQVNMVMGLLVAMAAYERPRVKIENA